ncbi:amino acid ABC transporter permease [Rhodoplanes sp. TEM]|uniref:Amino acid ABC transporter permease n=1 Tax=Rhodoplanes tepidamans TaxID=200616 RepID=A0ABT5JH71_RHOTP|nr:MULTISPECIES: amino acid ABC transporter permease [Rhodoplanes]MDC7788390.1 amino acid ABC transporter permease [Rhodoplanes tepidamans]MDC7985329.1 amino acid ABC transporter permease [Rhodoplanes sp. TEM]MDQ0357111.1 His/Glu/Gln/Arg/opine family amino acid ABC transporter permease subunit [Rhodoplanes tepidamans]
MPEPVLAAVVPEVIRDNLPFLAAGFAMTLRLAAVGIVGGSLVGLLLGLLRHAEIPVLSRLAALYIEIVRGTPLLVVLFVCYFAIPALAGYRTTAVAAASLGFVLFIAAYLAEDVRSGLRSVPSGLVRAGLATGLTRWQAFRLIVLPQALRRIIPPVFSQYVRLLKFTSVASVIGVRELTGSALLVNAREFQPVAIIATAAVTYLVVCSGLSLVGRLLDARLSIRT